MIGTIAVIGYGSLGSAVAKCYRDSGLDVIIGSRKGTSFERAKKDKFKVYEITDAVKRVEIIHFLIPDEVHGDVYKDIEPFLNEKKTMCFSHGFSIVFGLIKPPKMDVIMVAPNSIANELRSNYKKDEGIFGTIAIHRDVSGNATDNAKKLAESLKFSDIEECTFEQETYMDLFVEQSLLCGGVIELMKKTFEVLEGYPKRMAYHSIVRELKLVVDTINEHGIAKTNELISNTAEWGEYKGGPYLIDDSVKERMKDLLSRIESGEFAKGFIEEKECGFKSLRKLREKTKEHPLEKARKLI